jgi:hypothetical protein
MIRPDSILQLTAAILCGAAAGCSFQTAPLFQPGADAGNATLGATKTPDAHVPGAGQPTQTQLDAAVMPPSTSGFGADAASSTAAAPPVTTPAADAAPPSTPTTTGPDAATAAPADRCDAVGRYALELSMDVAWDSSAGFIEAGRGRANLYALVSVERVDPQTHAVTASGRVCGLSLPELDAMGGCASYQLRFDDALWDRPALPALQLGGTYACDTTNCNLQLDPTRYDLGLQLDDPAGPLPDAGVATGLQFPDDDGDGQPGITVDVVTQASTGTSSECAYPSAWTQNGAPDMNAAPASSWRLLLGARTQLMAAVGLGADCRVAQASGAAQSLDLRAAGCGFEPGSDPSDTMCAEEWRGAIDQSMPQYHVLGPGEAPPPSTSTSMSTRDVTPSQGTVVQAVKLDPAAMVGCREVRAMMF